MKQTITKEQLEELTDEQRVRLNKAWRNGGQVVNLLTHEDITIGQMIEFLDAYCLSTRQDWSICFGIKFALVGSSGNRYGRKEIKQKKKLELADALWEAVKEVLETEV